MGQRSVLSSEELELEAWLYSCRGRETSVVLDQQRRHVAAALRLTAAADCRAGATSGGRFIWRLFLNYANPVLRQYQNHQNDCPNRDRLSGVQWLLPLKSLPFSLFSKMHSPLGKHDLTRLLLFRSDGRSREACCMVLTCFSTDNASDVLMANT